MKILWVSLVKFPPICEYLGEKTPAFCGWLYSSAKALMLSAPDIELGVVVPTKESKMSSYVVEGIKYYLVPSKGLAKLSNKMISNCNNVIKDFSPDIIHLHGTEYALSLAMCSSTFKGPIIASIQGLADACSRFSSGGLTFYDKLYNISFRDICRLDTQFQIEYKFRKRGKLENALISRLSNIIGRTSWDKAHSLSVNSKIKYHFCNETLRDAFYNCNWQYSNCVPHSIFVSNSDMALKGAHQVLKALPFIVNKYPDTILTLIGVNVLSENWKVRARFTGYHLYLRRLIKKMKLESHVRFLGFINEEKMKDAFLSANVYVLPSSIENSPNSLCEAQILGVPIIASYVGGVPDLVQNNYTGYLYRYEEIEILAQLVINAFEMNDYADLSYAESNVASKRHDPQLNSLRIVEIYNKILL